MLLAPERTDVAREVSFHSSIDRFPVVVSVTTLEASGNDCELCHARHRFEIVPSEAVSLATATEAPMVWPAVPVMLRYTSRDTHPAVSETGKVTAKCATREESKFCAAEIIDPLILT